MSNSNIHGIDHNSNSNNMFTNNQYDPDQSEPIFAKFMYKGDPREQTIPNFLKESICPFFSFKSFSFIIIVINLVIYIITLIPHGLNDSELKIAFLPPSFETLYDFGNLQGYTIRSGFKHVYRWITHNLLHAHFEHVFSNNFCILIFGTMLEYLIGTWKYIIIYCASGILGGLFSVLIKPEVFSVGASICCYGLIGALLGFDMINYVNLIKIYGIQSRCIIFMIPFLMIIFTFPIMISTTEGSGLSESNNINIWGHIGGVIFGLLLSFFVCKPKGEADSCGFGYRIYKYFGIAAVASFTLIGFLCFYLLDKYAGPSK